MRGHRHLASALFASVLTSILILFLPSFAQAQVHRYTLMIGNNVGARPHTQLRYAESDATTMHDTLRDLGRVRAEDSVLMLGETADAVRSTLIGLNDRIRRSNEQAMLVVYYSGHGDASNLHLDGTLLPLSELKQLVSGSSATMRLLIVDSCRSGSLVRRKGGRAIAAFAVSAEPRLGSGGAVFLTSSSDSEDSQESDLIRGSFFTHYLVSGLLGAADRNADGNVDISEAYRYTYEATVRATSRTAAGLQHPTFRYDYAGQGEFVLVSPGAHDPRRARVSFPAGFEFLLLKQSANGQVVAEVAEEDQRRVLSLRAGTYYAIARAPTYLLEGSFEVEANATGTVDVSSFARVQYARLVRRGGTDVRSSSSVFVGYTGRSPIGDGASFCHGVTAGYAVDLPALSIEARLGYCGSRYTNRYLSASADQFLATLRFSRVFDVSVLSIAPGLEVGGGTIFQSFETAGDAPSRWIGLGVLGAALSISWDFADAYGVMLDLDGQTFFMKRGSQGDVAKLGATYAGQIGLGFLRRW